MNSTLTQKEKNINDILGQLEGVRRSGRGYLAKCPAHDDRSPSLSITQGDDGRILLYCHAGCSIKDFCAALGINLGDLFPSTKQMSPRQKKQHQRANNRIKAERQFEEMKRRAFIALVEFRNQTERLYSYHCPNSGSGNRDSMIREAHLPEVVAKAVHMLPQINWYIETLIVKTNEEQIELLRQGVIEKWARLYNSHQKTLI